MITRIERMRYNTTSSDCPSWMVSFNDLVLLILTFFILLFATAIPREEPWATASESIRSNFDGTRKVTNKSLEQGKNDADTTWHAKDHDPGLDTDYLHSLVKKYMASVPELNMVTTKAEDNTVVLSFPSDLIFDPGKATLSQKGYELISIITPFLTRLNNQIELVGHTDPTPIGINSEFVSNWQLSLMRAQAVADAMKKTRYNKKMAVRGQGAVHSDLLPKNLPETVRNERARRVDIRLRVNQP